MKDLTRGDVLGARELPLSRTTVDAFGMAGYLILTILGAYLHIRIPLTPVPITLQTFFVFLGAAALGKKRAVFTQGAYLFLGGLGLPIFFGAGGGLSHLLGPTGGYLFGFLIAAGIVGHLTRRRLDFPELAAIFCLGEIVILLLGTLGLSLFLKIGLREALFLGALPFIPGDVLKVLAAAFFYQKSQVRLREIF